VEYLLLRQHVSALALGHHQVSNCASEETIQCSIVHNHAHFTYRVLTPDIAYDLDFIILASPDNCQWSRYQRDLVGWYELCEYYTV